MRKTCKHCGRTTHTRSDRLRHRFTCKKTYRMSSKARATYDRIRKLREEIGPIGFDVVKALRELREDDKP